MNQTEYAAGNKFKAARLHLVPPIHLLWDGDEARHIHQFLRAYQLHEEIRERIRRGDRGFSTNTWKKILNDEYWKRQFPTTTPFSPTRFFRFGGLEFFGAQNDAVKSGGHEPIAQLSCGCKPDLQVFADDDARYCLVYKLSLQAMYEDLIALDMKLSGSPVDPARKILFNKFVWFRGNLAGWNVFEIEDRLDWLRVLRDIVRCYPRIDDVTWRFWWPPAFKAAGLDTVSEEDTATARQLRTNVFRDFEVHFLSFYITTMLDNLGHLPAPMLVAPRTFNIVCSRHNSPESPPPGAW